MQLEQVPAPRRRVQAVHVLRHERHARQDALHAREREVPLVRPRAAQLLEAPRVEPPHLLGVAREGLGRREVLRAIPFPQAAGAAEGRKAALGRDARSGQHGERAPGQKLGQEVEERREERLAHGTSRSRTRRSRPRVRKSSGTETSASSPRRPGPHGEIPHAARGRRARARGSRRRLRARGDSRHLGARRRGDGDLGEHGQAGHLRELRLERLARLSPRGQEARKGVERRKSLGQVRCLDDSGRLRLHARDAPGRREDDGPRGFEPEARRGPVLEGATGAVGPEGDRHVAHRGRRRARVRGPPRKERDEIRGRSRRPRASPGGRAA